MTFLLIVIGLFSLLAPRAAWYMEIGWKLKDSEPSEGVLNLNRIIGFVLILVGILKFFLDR